MTSNNSGIRKKRQLRACKICGHPYDTTKAQCPACKAWDSPNIVVDNDETVALSEVSSTPLMRIQGTGPWDPVFSYRQYPQPDGTISIETGIVAQQVAIVGGAPGAGKSTMALQLCNSIAEITGRDNLYIAAEESKEQVKDRALRLNLKHAIETTRIRVYPMGASTDLGQIFQQRKPAAVIVDSLPGITGDPDQAVEYCKAFKDYAVALNCPFIVIDHITKDHDLAGLMALQHEVDTLIMFTLLDEKRGIRSMSSATKNRFGAAQEIFLQMTQTGLVEAKGYTDESDGDDGETDRDWTDD